MAERGSDHHVHFVEDLRGWDDVANVLADLPDPAETARFREANDWSRRFEQSEVFELS